MLKITATDIQPLIAETNGNVAAIARRFGCARSTIQTRIDKSPTLALALVNARESMKDNAESSLYRLVLDGNVAAVIFYLKTQAKDRGYVERQEVTGKDGGEVGLTVKRLSDADEADIDAEIARLEGIMAADQEGALFAESDRLPRGFALPE